MPQIAQIAETYASQIFWLLIVFGLVYFVIGRGMLPKIEATVDARDRKIADDLAAAQRARAAADETEEAYRTRMNEARAQAQAATQAAKAGALSETEKRVKAADEALAARTAAADVRIADAQSQALASIEDVAADAAQDIVARIAGQNVSREQAAAAVRAALAQG